MESGKRRGIVYALPIVLGLALLSVILADSETPAPDAFEGLSVIVVILCALYLYSRWPGYKALMEPAEDLSRANVGDVVEVDGTLQAGDEALPAPFSENETLGVLWTVSELQGNGRYTDWKTIAGGGGTADPILKRTTGQDAKIELGPIVDTELNSGTRMPLTTLKVGTGNRSLLGDGMSLDGVSFEFGGERTVYDIDAGEEPPSHVASFLQSQDIEPVGEKEWTVGMQKRGARKLKEAYLNEGDTVFIRGEVTEKGFDAVTLGKTDDGPTIVADIPKEEYITTLQTFIYLTATLVAVHTAYLVFMMVQGAA